MGGEFESTYYNGGRSAHPTIASISGGMGGEFESTYYNGGRSAHPTIASLSGGMGVPPAIGRDSYFHFIYQKQSV
jgi:hypothetical protein